MIVRVWSDLPTFRDVQFEDGMNVVLADRAADSDETESTNGLGKTTLLRIIHFCLGSDMAREKVLKHPRLRGVTFALDFRDAGRTVTVRRNTLTYKSVTVSADFLLGMDFQPEASTDEDLTISVDDWKRVLTLKFSPSMSNEGASTTFREIALYLIRVGKAAFSDPLTAFQGQSGPSKRLTASYLLGLNWGSQKKLQNLIDARAQVDAAIKALKTAESSWNDKSIGDLEAERVSLEAMIAEKRTEVESFNVRADYRELENSLENVDRRLHDLINENHSDRRLLEHYKKSSAELPEADSGKPVSILKNAGAIFRKEALQNLEQIAAFHADVHRNRAEFLKGEINKLAKDIRGRSVEIEYLADNKSGILGVLRSSGALEQLIELQRTYTDQTSQYEVLKARIAERVRFDVKKDDLSAEIAHERALMKRDMDDRKKTIDEARLLFAQYTSFLYGKPGALSIDVNSAGYNLTFSIDRAGSDGVDQMVVFCFDLVVATLRARRNAGFSTLIHDSSLFADVDPRQYGLALRLAEERSRSEGFQYICSLNSGALPTQHLGDFSLLSFIRLRLTDEGDEGRLLGMRLPPSEAA